MVASRLGVGIEEELLEVIVIDEDEIKCTIEFPEDPLDFYI